MTLKGQESESNRTGSLFPEMEPRPGQGPDLRKAAALWGHDDSPSPDAASTPRGQGTDLRTGDLFAWGARQQQLKVRSTAPQAARSMSHRGRLQGPARVHGPRAAPPVGVLAGGPAGRALDGHGASRIRRNRVYFLLLLAALALFVCGSLLIGR